MGAAATGTPSVRSRAYTASSSPAGPPIIWCVARPAIASVLRSNARLAALLARSMATITDTPKAIPRIIRPVCQGWRSR